MTQAKLNAFIADITALKSSTHFWAPSINIDGRFAHWHTSVHGLITWLRANVNAPQPTTIAAAVARCASVEDSRLLKYMPCIERLVSCWGRPAAYPAVAAVEERRSKAMWKFAKAIHRWNGQVAPALIPEWHDLERYVADPFRMGVGVTGYLVRLANPNGGNLDITARSMLLRAGLLAALNETVDRGYLVRLGLTQAHLEAMRNRSLLDVACGGAIFGAEAMTLYGAIYHGLDFNAAQVPAAVAEGQRRYVRGALFLKMLRDLGHANRSPIPAWASEWVKKLVTRVPDILQAYANNPPHQGDILAARAAFAVAIAGVGNGRFDYVTCMYLLCYFTPDEQTRAVINMCSVANRTVYLYNGAGAVLTQTLTYRQADVTQAFPRCRIEVIDAATHHIHMQ